MTSLERPIGDIVRGRDGWLFLGEGSNGSYSYLTGERPMAGDASSGWRQVIQRRNTLFPNCVHLICPEKLAVYPEEVDGIKIDDQRLAVHLANLERVIYPIEELRRARFENVRAYQKVDTHFTELGALVAARAVLDAFGLDAMLEPNWRVHTTSGDLGNKMDPPERSETVSLVQKPSVEIHDNGMINRGRILYLRNTNPDANTTGGRLLVFGDSYTAGNLGRILALFFSEVLFVHSLAADYRMISRFAPDRILFELAERFIRSVPNDALSFESLLVHKYLDKQREAVCKWREDRENLTHGFVDWSIIDHCRPL